MTYLLCTLTCLHKSHTDVRLYLVFTEHSSWFACTKLTWRPDSIRSSFWVVCWNMGQQVCAVKLDSISLCMHLNPSCKILRIWRQLQLCELAVDTSSADAGYSQKGGEGRISILVFSGFCSAQNGELMTHWPPSQLDSPVMLSYHPPTHLKVILILIEDQSHTMDSSKPTSRRLLRSLTHSATWPHYTKQISLPSNER